MENINKEKKLKIEILQYFWNNRDKNIIPKVSRVLKQKVMLFYNLFAYVNDFDFTFDKLEAFEKGPVYRDIYEDTKSENIYLEKINIQKNENDFTLNINIAQLTTLLAEIMESNLSEISHKFDMWCNKINNKNKKIYINDITEKDKDIVSFLYKSLIDIKDNYILYKNKLNAKLLIDKKHYSQIINIYLKEIESLNNFNIPYYLFLQNGELVID